MNSSNKGNMKNMFEEENSMYNLSSLSNAFNFGQFSPDFLSVTPQNQKVEKKGLDGLSPSKDQKVYNGKNRSVRFFFF
jgi:hypothetical protein